MGGLGISEGVRGLLPVGFGGVWSGEAGSGGRLVVSMSGQGGMDT